MVLLSSDWVSRALPYFGSCYFTFNFAYKTFTLFGRLFQNRSAIYSFIFIACPNPVVYHYTRFRLFPFRSPLLRKSIIFFLFLRVLRCFSSPGSPQHTMYSCEVTLSKIGWVSSFGYLRIRAHLQLPVAFRSLSRPSSASSAKASTLCSS